MTDDLIMDPAEEIFVLNNGNIVQSGSPVDIYDEPINHYVADFIGESNIVDGAIATRCLCPPDISLIPRFS